MQPEMNHPFSETLLPLIERLDKLYYDNLIVLCSAAQKYAQKLKDLEANSSTSQYVSLCLKLVDEIQSLIAIKKEHFIPYALTMFDKSNTGHDCSSCQGGCNLHHDIQLKDMKQSHMQLKDIIYRVQMVALPLYSETIYPDVYRLLRNHMALIENTLTELFSLEETRLIPKIIEAQKTINARA